MSLNVLHVSPTPLVGSPSKIATAQALLGVNSSVVILKDYPVGGPLAGKFLDGAIVWETSERPDARVQELIIGIIRRADIIHVHNDLPASFAGLLREYGTRAKFVYQVHSPLREGPLYYDRAEPLGLPFEAFLVVSQYQPRHYPRFTPVPNIVNEKPSVNLLKAGEKISVIFSPSHARSGRWNVKHSAVLDETLKSLHLLGKCEYVRVENPIAPHVLSRLRRECHVSIDEIMTGAFHQVSLEGLCAGNVVVNRADFFSKAMLKLAARANELPPFVHADEITISNVLLDLVENPEKVVDLQKASYNYFVRNLAPERLAKVYTDVYESIV